MSGFTPTVKYELDFDGDHITFELRRMKVKHHAAVMRAVEGDSAGRREVLIVETAQSVLPDCVVSMSGLTIDGKPASVADIVDETYFLPLMDKLLAELIRVSRVREVDAKNSDGLPADTSRG